MIPTLVAFSVEPISLVSRHEFSSRKPGWGIGAGIDMKKREGQGPSERALPHLDFAYSLVRLPPAG